MFKRFPYLSLLIAVAVAALAAVPAMATDEVPAPPAPPVPPAQSAPAPTGGSCTDSSKPSTRISTKAGRSAHSSLTVRGKSSDRGCGASGSGAVSRVTVSVQRKNGKRCQFMSSKGKLGSKKSCGSPKWLSAHGTSSWSFGMPKSLPRGTYLVRVRAHDSAGNVGARKSLHVRMR